MDHSLTFLPVWPIAIDGLITFAILIFVGLIGGRLAQRTGFLPRITGFIIIGLILGPSVLGWITPDILKTSQTFVDIALGLILFQLGWQLNIKLVLNEKSLLIASLAEASLSFIAIYFVLRLFGLGVMESCLAGAIGISSSPAVVLLVVRELGAKGPLTDRTLLLVAINNVISFLVFTSLLPLAYYLTNTNLQDTILAPMYMLLASLFIGYFMAKLLLLAAKLLPRDENSQFAIIIATIVGAVGISQALNASPLLALLMYGVFTRNLDTRKILLPMNFGSGAEIFFVILFVVAGARLHLSELWHVGLAAAGFVLARFVGKQIGALALSMGNISIRQASWLGLNLMPMAGMAIGLTQTLAASFPDYSIRLAAVILGAIAILETIGPIATEYGLKHSGEVDANAILKH